MGDSALVLTGIGWLFINAILLAFVPGVSTVTFETPQNPYRLSGGTNTTTTTFDTVLCSAAVIAGAVAGGAGGALLGFGIGGIAGAALGGTFVGSLIGCSVVQDTVVLLFDLGSTILNFFGFLFQLLTFQIPGIPIWLNAIIVLPPASMLSFVALKTIRGAGG